MTKSSKIGAGLLALTLCFSALSAPVKAAYVSRFDTILFDPAVDGGDYYTVYGSQNLKAGQGNVGFYFDYANKPLQFIGIGAVAGQRQSVIDNIVTLDIFGAVGVTDWFEVGLNIPVVLYNWFFQDIAGAPSDHGGGMGDIQMMGKFRIVNTENGRVGFAVQPFLTLPSGDTARYTGNGTVTGGINLITDFIFNDRFSMAVNTGATLHDNVTRNGVNIDDQFNYGVAGNVKFTKNLQGIVEMFGDTNIKDPFGSSGHSPLEAGGGLRYIFGDSGFAANVGGSAGIIDGVGSPQYRGFAGLTWSSPVHQAPPPPAPDPRIVNNKIILTGKIFYDVDKDTLKSESYPVLNDVVDVLQKNPQVRLVEVQGHTDSSAGDEHNMKLSQRRAESAVRYIVSKGVDASRLMPKGYGETRPIASNATKEGMSENRRTEFVIIQQDVLSVPEGTVPQSINGVQIVPVSQ